MSEFDPTQHLPSFEEFARNREKYLGREDENFAQVDGSSRVGGLRSKIVRHQYEIEGYRCKTLEEVERIAKNQGIPIRELDYRPEVIPIGGGKCDILVKFVPNHVREKRKNW